jgi:hypothetical protein
MALVCCAGQWQGGGTTALNRADVGIPGKGDERDNRLTGLGPLSGIGVGVAVGTAAGLRGSRRVRTA